MNKTTLSFTLIELLIVIVIIGILATSLIPRLTGLQDKAKYTRVQKDFETFRTAVFMAQNNTQKTLKMITNNGFTANYCGSSAFVTNLSTYGPTDRCILDRISALRSIELAAGMSSGELSQLERDPRGNPYLLDENERDGSASDCRFDTLHTAGPDEIPQGINLSNALGDTGDNRGINISSIFCPSAY